jgi:hypothetical protein
MKKLILLISIISSINANIIDNYLEELKKEAKIENTKFIGFSYERGKEIYFKEMIGKRGKKISCASCHTNDLRKSGENMFTGKIIKPISPIINKKRFTKVKKIKKWLRRNFKDVYKREGTAQEKGDVLVFMNERK